MMAAHHTPPQTHSSQARAQFDFVGMHFLIRQDEDDEDEDEDEVRNWPATCAWAYVVHALCCAPALMHSLRSIIVSFTHPPWTFACFSICHPNLQAGMPYTTYTHSPCTTDAHTCRGHACFLNKDVPCSPPRVLNACIPHFLTPIPHLHPPPWPPQEPAAGSHKRKRGAEEEEEEEDDDEEDDE